MFPAPVDISSSSAFVAGGKVEGDFITTQFVPLYTLSVFVPVFNHAAPLDTPSGAVGCATIGVLTEPGGAVVIGLVSPK